MAMGNLSLFPHPSEPTWVFSMPVPFIFHFQRTPNSWTVALPWLLGSENISLGRKLPQAVSLVPTAQACLHLASTCTPLPSFYQQIPLYYSNNAPLVPGKPTWCTKMLCNTKWLLPLVLLKNGNSSKISFLLCSHQVQWLQFPFFFFFNMKQTTSVTIHVWGLFLSLLSVKYKSCFYDFCKSWLFTPCFCKPKFLIKRIKWFVFACSLYSKYLLKYH